MPDFTINISPEARAWLEWKAMQENASTTAQDRAAGVFSEPEHIAMAIIEGAYQKAADAGELQPDLSARVAMMDEIPF